MNLQTGWHAFRRRFGDHGIHPNKRYITRSKKGIESMFCWEYENVSEGTRLHLEVEYKVPLPLIGKLAEAIIIKQNEHEVHNMLHNLKDRMEIQVPIVA